MSAETMAGYLKQIERYQPVSLFGYPSSLALLAEFALGESGRAVRCAGLKAVFVTGEKLYEHQRRLLERAFGVVVADCLGSRDAGFLAHECPAGSMHLTSESVIVEIVDADGYPARAGELGEIVVTHLENYVLPFIRYRTGDLGRLAAGLCRCGRHLPRLLVTEGRTTDQLVRADGTLVHALAVIYALRELRGIKAFKVHQPSVHEVIVRVVQGADYAPENDALIIGAVQGRLGNSVGVRVMAVDTIPPERSGKFRYVTSDVNSRVLIHEHATRDDPSVATAG